MLKMHEIRELIRLVDQSSITNFEYEFEGLKVSVKKEGQAVKVTSPALTNEGANQEAPAPQQSVQPIQTEVKEPQQAPQAPAVQEDATLHKIVSPMVGTFYKAPAPDADPYVSVGDKVKEDTVVCIVEAMKLMNEIEAEIRGEIVEVLVENGQLVEYGQPLFLVKPE